MEASTLEKLKLQSAEFIQKSDTSAKLKAVRGPPVEPESVRMLWEPKDQHTILNE